jgi:hypothetical protein
LSEVQIVQANAFNGIGIDALLPRAVQPFYSDGAEVDNSVFKQSTDCVGYAVVYAGSAVEAIAGQSFAGFYWGTAVGSRWSCPIVSKDIIGETANRYSEAISYMHNRTFVKVRDVVGSEFCIGFRDGNRIFESIQDAILKGKHVVVSFENISSLSAAFLESAIGQLFRSGISEEKLKKYITWKGVSPERMLLIKRAIAEAKEIGP